MMPKPADALPAQLHDVDLRLLRVFVTIVDCGGISAAEPRLNMANSTISTHLARLEARLQVTLCRRGRGGFALTAAGRKVHAEAIQLFESLDRFRRNVGAVASAGTEELRIVVPDSLMYSLVDVLAPVIREFGADRPQTLLDIDVAAPALIDRMLVDGTADIGFGSPTRRARNLRFVDLRTELVALYCGASHPLRRRAAGRLAMEDVLEYEIVRAEGYYYPRSIVRSLKAHAAASCTPLDGRVVLAASGRYLAFLSRDYAQAFVERGLIFELPLEAFRYENRIAASMRADQQKPAARRFFEYLERRSEAAA